MSAEKFVSLVSNIVKKRYHGDHIPMAVARPLQSLPFAFLTIVAAATLLVTNSGWADEAAAVAKIEEAGGTVRKIAQSVEWREVAYHLSDKEVTDEALAPLADVPELTWLYLQGTKISDAGLKHIAGIKTLTKLHLEKTEIGDDGLVHLKGLDKLEYLNLYGTKVTDKGLEHLSEMKSLKKLYLWQSAATAEGVNKLKESLTETEVVLGASLAKPKPKEEKKEEEKKEEGKEGKPADEPAKESLAKGRFVRVRLEGKNRILSLAEVQVFQTKDNAELHKAGKATQSSDDFSGAPNRANDGKTNQNYNDGSVTHTKSEDNPWWQLDLGATKEIGRIKVWNRSDCCGDRLKDGVVEVLDESQKVVYTGKIMGAKDSSVHVLQKK